MTNETIDALGQTNKPADGKSVFNAGLDTTHCKAPLECKHLPIESRADWLVHCERCKHDSMGYGAEDRYVPNVKLTGLPLNKGGKSNNK